jgi:glycosyltransferase involved in cell wall biosynthesis
MKILLINNFYKSKYPSGENSLFKEEARLLSNKTNKIKIYKKYSDNIKNKNKNLLFVGISYIWNFKSQHEINKLLDKFKPDIIHIHNTFPLISNSILILKKKIPIFLTLHNLRIFCAAGNLLRKKKVCTLCIDKKSIIPSLRYKCYQKSFFKTLPIAINIFILRFFNILNKQNIFMLAFSKFQKNLLVKAGIKDDRIFIKKNFLKNDVKYINFDLKDNYITFVGRISNEKGVDKLIKCWNLWGDEAPNLKIIGDGPLLSIFKNINTNKNIEFLGYVERKKTIKIIAKSKMLIFPTQCYEGLPMTILEAFSVKTPVIASNLGPISEIIKNNVNGILFKYNSSHSLYKHVKYNWHNHRLKKISENAYQDYLNLYSDKVNYNNLVNIYKKANNKR